MTPSRSHSHHITTLHLAQRSRRHVPPLVTLCTVDISSKKLLDTHIRADFQMHAVIRETLTSPMTAAGYGRGARVRTLVPSRILPRASPVNPNSCSQGDLAGEGRKEKGEEGAA